MCLCEHKPKMFTCLDSIALRSTNTATGIRQWSPFCAPQPPSMTICRFNPSSTFLCACANWLLACLRACDSAGQSVMPTSSASGSIRLLLMFVVTVIHVSVTPSHAQCSLPTCASCLVEKASFLHECSWCTKANGDSFCFDSNDRSSLCASPGDGYHSHSCPVTCPLVPGTSTCVNFLACCKLLGCGSCVHVPTTQTPLRHMASF